MLCLPSLATISGGTRNFYLGVIAPGVWGMEVPQWDSGQNSSRGLRAEVPEKLKQFADTVYRF